MAAAGIPKTMNIIPTMQGVNKFVTDTRKVQTSVDKMVKGVNSSLGRLKSSSAALGGTSTVINRVNNSIKGNLSSLNKWADGFNAVNNPLTRFGSTLSTVGRSITRFSFQLERMGRGMLIAFTLPFIAAGIAVTKTAIDFEDALVKVENLVGVSKNVVAKWGEEILEFSTRLAVMPIEAANGLFAAASGFGEIAAQAPVMEVLENSIMAMNIGLGETEDIARAVTAMMNTFSGSSLDAAKATSLLVLGVREGNLEVDKLSTSLGNVLGVASFVGAAADDVLAFISAYTRFGVEPTRAVTALNTALTNLIKPSGKNREILEAYGLTLESIKEKISGPAGLANLFLEMEQNMSQLDFISIFGLRSLRAVAAVTNSVSGFNEEYMRIAVNMQEETGRTFTFMAAMAEKGSKDWKMYMKQAIESGEKGMNSLEESIIRTMETLGWKFKQIKSLFSQIFLGVDSAIAPFLRDFADKIIDILEKTKEFIETNKETVKLIVKIAAALALAGPAILIFARVFQAFGVLVSSIGGVLTIIGVATGMVVNLILKFAILAVNIVMRVIPAFLSLGKFVYVAVAAMFRLAVVTAQYIALGLGLAFIRIVNAAGSMAGVIANLTVGMIGLLSTLSPIIAAGAAIVATIGAIGGAVLLIIGGLQKFGEAITTVFDSVLNAFGVTRDFFNDLAGDGRTWGEGLMQEFSKGIYDGLIYLVDALIAVGNVIASWLKGMSPPRIAPDIDIWGQKTMQEWIDGWLKADFSVFNTIQDKIQSFLNSLAASTGDDDEDGIIPKMILGSRAAIAEAINQVRLLGKVTQDVLDKIYTAIGTTTLELENYIEAMLAAAITTDALADAQQRVNDINEKYSKLLSPIQKQLEEIDAQRQGLSDSREIEYLNRLLERGNLTEQVADLARLRIQEIGLQQQQAEIEGQRDAELSVAEQQLQAAEETNETAQRRLEFAEESLGLQTKGFDLMAQMIKKVESIKESVAKIPKKLTGISDTLGGILEAVDFGDPPDISGLGWDGGDGEGGPLSDLDAKLEELKIKLEELSVTWGNVWQGMINKYAEWVAAGEAAYNDFKTKFFDRYGPTLTALEVEGRRTWDNYSGIIKDFWKEIEPDLILFVDKLKEMGSGDIANAPAVITAISNAINGPLAAALKGILGILADTVFDADFWANLFKPPDPATLTLADDIANIFENLKLPEGKSEFDLFTEWLGKEPITYTTEELSDMLQLPDLVSVINSWFEDDIGPALSQSWTDLWAGNWGKGEGDDIVKIEPPPLSESWGPIWKEISDGITGAYDALNNFLEPLKGVKMESDTASGGTDGYSGGIYGLGSGFFTLGTETDIARLALEFAEAALINLKQFGIDIVDKALITLDETTELMRLKWEEFREKVEEVKDWVLDLAERIEEEMITALTNLYNYLIDNLNEAVQDFLDLLVGIYNIIKNKLEKVIDNLKKKFEDFKGAIDPLLDPLRTLISLLETAWNLMKNIAGGATGGDAGGGGSGGYGSDDDEDDDDPSKNVPQSVNNPDPIKEIVDSIPSIPVMASSPTSSPVATVAAGVGANVATNGGVAITFGNVIISNDMDMATFEARVRTAVASSMTN